MHHIFVRKTEKCEFHCDVCDETGVCNVFAEYKTPHPVFPQIMCGASEHVFQIRKGGETMIFHDRFVSAFPLPEFEKFLSNEGLCDFMPYQWGLFR